MNTLQIIAKANEVIKGANFTKIMKVRRANQALYLIVALSDNTAIYGSYTNDNYYAIVNGQMVRLA